MSDISRRLFLKKGVAGLAAVAVAPGLISCAGQDGKAAKVRQLAPLAGKYDVVVAGGGPAGFIAAVTAARQGAKTALIERYGFLGGMATTGYVTRDRRNPLGVRAEARIHGRRFHRVAESEHRLRH